MLLQPKTADWPLPGPTRAAWSLDPNNLMAFAIPLPADLVGKALGVDQYVSLLAASLAWALAQEIDPEETATQVALELQACGLMEENLQDPADQAQAIRDLVQENGLLRQHLLDRMMRADYPPKARSSQPAIAAVRDRSLPQWSAAICLPTSSLD